MKTGSNPGYYAYGASAGREWYLNASMQFKDDTVSDADVEMLDRAFEKVRWILNFQSLRYSSQGRRPTR